MNHRGFRCLKESLHSHITINMSSVVKILSLLEAYEERQQEAQACMKTSQWKITKHKHIKGAMAKLTASNVREELRSRCLLLEEEPGLIDEDETAPNLASSRIPHFRLVDPVEQKQTDKENAATSTTATAKPSNATQDGLRNRKAKGAEDSSLKTKEWTVTEDSQVADEETKLRLVDPIDLFGLPTKELREARMKAHQAVALYVEAANLLLALQQEIKK